MSVFSRIIYCIFDIFHFNRNNQKKCNLEHYLQTISKEFSLKSDAEFTFPFNFHRKLGQNLKRLEPCVS